MSAASHNDIKRTASPPQKPLPLRLRPGARWVTATALMTFVLGTYAYTLRSVSQEDFSDIDESGNKIRERPQV